LQRDVKITIVSGIVFLILSLIVGDLWHQITPIFLNILFSQNIPINQYQAYLGITLFGFVLISGAFFAYYFIQMFKKKPIEPPPAGTQYKQIGCPKCGSPNFVIPPTEDYRQVVFSKCKDKGVLQENHNVKSWSKCPNCNKKFDFYWCRGHPQIISKGNNKPPNDDDGYVTGIDNKRGYKSKLRDELRELDDNLSKP
jgi:hypothetical protein